MSLTHDRCYQVVKARFILSEMSALDQVGRQVADVLLELLRVKVCGQNELGHR